MRRNVSFLTAKEESETRRTSDQSQCVRKLLAALRRCGSQVGAGGRREERIGTASFALTHDEKALSSFVAPISGLSTP